MGFHESDRVVATRDIDNTVTGLGVRAGTPGVVLRQVGTMPATFRVRFAPAEEPAGRSIVVDDLTDHDIAPGYEDGGV